MGDQRSTQAIVVPGAKRDPNQKSLLLALFDLEGSEIDLAGGGGAEVTVGDGIALSTFVLAEDSVEMAGTMAFLPFSGDSEVTVEAPVGGGWVFVGGAAEVHSSDEAGGFNVMVCVDGLGIGPQVASGVGAPYVAYQSSLVAVSLDEGSHTLDIGVQDDAAAIEVFARKRRLTVLPLF